ncbi:hypothetical protein AB0L63_26910 [Nocardia sp. NPDC051990]|uniref:hypothetical protein n=1 Tax=Nocardia sp. NPDC051990 TaxID=3155285 RepID=UPI0034403E81
MAVLSRSKVSLAVVSLAMLLGVAVAVSMLATLAFAAIGHPECATIPEDVGPCGYWARVAYYGPFIMLWGTVVLAVPGVTVWLVVVAALALFAALRHRRESSPPQVTAKRPRVIIASLNRFVDDEDPDWIWWSCKYELRGESVGIDDSGNPDLQDVVNGVLDYAREWSNRYDITIEWTVDGDPPDDGTVEDAIAALGVTLPARIPGM